MHGRFIAYYRADSADRSRAGLESGKTAVRRYLDGGKWKMLAEFHDGPAKRASTLERSPALRDAIAAAKKHDARLLIAKFDYLSGKAQLVSGLIDSQVRFVCADLPEANERTVQLMAALARRARERISARTKKALAAKKARGEPVGNPALLRPYNKARQKKADAFAESLRRTLRGYRQAGLTQRAMVEALNSVAIKAPRGGRWSLVQLQRTLRRLDT